MRDAFCQALVRRASRPEFVFMTGDLGFMALEPLQKAAGDRFINAGVAEQNMVSVAAGLARQGLEPWAYSICPFIYARPLEQIRNDICLHDLPVKLVGNGGGYGYGVMGATHHAIEDYGLLLSLQHMHVFLPAFDADLEPMVEKMSASKHPSYLRLGRDEKPKDFVLPAYAPWRKLMDGKGPVLVVAGPLAGSLVGALLSLPLDQRPSLWVVGELPLEETSVPVLFLEELKKSGSLAVAEEHVAHGGLAETLSRYLLLKGAAPKQFRHFCAQGYPSGYYGSQAFHRRESGMAPEQILGELGS